MGGKKNKTVYVCSECGEDHIKWQGQCKSCKAWNTLKEFKISPNDSQASTSGQALVRKVKPRSLDEVQQRKQRDQLQLTQYQNNLALFDNSIEDLSDNATFNIIQNNTNIKYHNQLDEHEISQLDLKTFDLSSSKTSYKASKHSGYAGLFHDGVTRISQVKVKEISRTLTGFDEFDRVLGGGLVPGSAILVGGHPGAGKSTILLQIVAKLSSSNKILYITGEESLEQVKMRAQRVGLPEVDYNLLMLSETSIDRIIEVCEEQQPDIVIIDSIQVMALDGIASSPGSVSQVRESAAALTRYAKQTHTSIIMVGHVTKDGNLAGPKVLEHVIDCSLMIESAEDTRYRIIRSTKNRFGAVNEIGVFMMDSHGLHQVKNPSAIFLSRSDEQAPGSCIVVLWEGSRPLIVEIQSLVDNSNKDSSRRISNGFDNNRLSMLLAIMAKHGRVQIYNHEVYVNVVGGIKVNETSADLAVVLAILSSYLNKLLPRGLICLGELGLSGELRPVAMCQERLSEAAKHGFNTAIIPSNNKINIEIPGMQIRPAKNLQEAFAIIRELLQAYKVTQSPIENLYTTSKQLVTESNEQDDLSLNNIEQLSTNTSNQFDTQPVFSNNFE